MTAWVKEDMKPSIKPMDEGHSIIAKTAKEPSTTTLSNIKVFSEQDTPNNNLFIHDLNCSAVTRLIYLTVPRPIIFIKQPWSSFRHFSLK